MNFLEISNRSFSPRDYQTELLSHAYEENIITCLPSKQAKEFIALKLIQELSHELRRKNGRKISLYITKSTSVFNLVHYLTDLKVINLNEAEEIDWQDVKQNYQVILIEAEECLSAIENSSLDLNSVNVLVIDDCHSRKRELSTIFLNYYKKAKRKPKVFGLAGALYSASCSTGRLGAEIECLEGILDARAETASDIVTVLR
jgi:endoribonuclease Dicer